MNKSELISRIADKSELAKTDSAKALNALIQTINDELSSGGSITITGFGNFIVRNRAARIGRNPQTGETIQIKACKIPAFKAGKILKDAVNG